MKDTFTIGIKIDREAPLAQTVQILRGYCDDGMAVITERVRTEQDVLSCEYTDPAGLKDILACCKQLESAGIEFSVHELNGIPTTIEFLKNLDQTYDEIEEE